MRCRRQEQVHACIFITLSKCHTAVGSGLSILIRLQLHYMYLALLKLKGETCESYCGNIEPYYSQPWEPVSRDIIVNVSFYCTHSIIVFPIRHSYMFISRHSCCRRQALYWLHTANKLHFRTSDIEGIHMFGIIHLVINGVSKCAVLLQDYPESVHRVCHWEHLGLRFCHSHCQRCQHVSLLHYYRNWIYQNLAHRSFQTVLRHSPMQC